MVRRILAVRYTPKPNYFGPDAFTYKIVDATGLEAEGTVNILVKSVNDTPAGADVALTLNRNASVEIIFAAEIEPGCGFAVEGKTDAVGISSRRRCLMKQLGAER